MTRWLEKYVPLCTEAMKSLKVVWGLQKNGELTFESVEGDAKRRFNEILSEIQLGLPQGVTL